MCCFCHVFQLCNYVHITVNNESKKAHLFQSANEMSWKPKASYTNKPSTCFHFKFKEKYVQYLATFYKKCHTSFCVTVYSNLFKMHKVRHKIIKQ